MCSKLTAEPSPLLQRWDGTDAAMSYWILEQMYLSVLERPIAALLVMKNGLWGNTNSSLRTVPASVQGMELVATGVNSRNR